MEKSLNTVRKIHLLLILVCVTIFFFALTKDWDYIEKIKKAISELNRLKTYSKDKITDKAVKIIFGTKTEYNKIVKILDDKFIAFKTNLRSELEKLITAKRLELNNYRQFQIMPNETTVSLTKQIKKLDVKRKFYAARLKRETNRRFAFLQRRGLNLKKKIEELQNKIKKINLLKTIASIEQELNEFESLSLPYCFTLKDINLEEYLISKVALNINITNGKKLNLEYFNKAWPTIMEILKNNIELIKKSEYYQIIPNKGIAFYVNYNTAKNINLKQIRNLNEFNRNHRIEKSNDALTISNEQFVEIIFSSKKIIEIPGENVILFEQIFPNLCNRTIMVDIKQNKYDGATVNLEKLLISERDKDLLELAGIKVSAKNIAMIGPIIIIVLLYYMLSVMIHVFRIKDKVKDKSIINSYLWMGLFKDFAAWLLTPITIIGFSITSTVIVIEATRSLKKTLIYPTFIILILIPSIWITWLSYKLRKEKKV